ncbi:MAG: DUF4838 domain-containing protein [Armatimonadota bacterium]|jgi:hypothetical protein
MRSLTLVALALIALCAVAFAEVPLVTNGQARAVIVIPAEPLPVAQYAAEELAYHVERATGVALPIVTEDAVPEAESFVYVGATDAAREAGIDVDALAFEETVLRAEGNALIIAGQDEGGDPLAQDTNAGTLWGVYELLERELGVVWMWPGELGTHVPEADEVVVADLDERFEPWLIQRNVRHGMIERGEPITPRFTADGRVAYAHDQSVFLRRHRMGRNHPLSYGHAFNAWWDRYGDEHPEWFQLVNGRRGPTSPGARFSMCVSDPGYHERIIANWLEQREADPDAVININVCENDIRGLCECETCLSWDGPQPDSINPRFGPRVVSDRYARFWGIICEKAMEIDPDAIVMTYAYVNYAPPPSADITLPPNLLIGVVPDLFFPRTEEQQQFIFDMWSGWARTGASIFLRPNYTLHGYVMPHIYVRQFAEEFAYKAEHGMRATDFDSLSGQWATQGTNNYALMRLHQAPQQDIDEMLAEYYSGFGPAADAVREYFDFFEAYTTQMADQPGVDGTLGIFQWSRYAADAHRAFPEPVLNEGAAILQRAREAAAGEEPWAARVEFLQLGLEHARLCADVARLLAGEDAEVSPFAVGRKLAELEQFRRDHEGTNFSNLHFAAYIEQRSWEVSEGYTGEQLRPVAEVAEPLAEGAHFSLRGGHSIVAVLGAGETFRARIETKRVGNNDSPITWALVSPDDEVLERGSIRVGESAEIDVPVQADGTYACVVQTSHNNARVTPLNDHSAVAAPKLSFIYETSPVYFWVPEGTEEFALGFYGMYPGEQVRLRVYDPEGNEAAVQHTHQAGTIDLPVAVGAGHDGAAWSVTFEQVEDVTMEDYSVIMDPDLPPYWSLAPYRLVVP